MLTRAIRIKGRFTGDIGDFDVDQQNALKLLLSAYSLLP